MGTEPLERKLTAILYADVAGYSRLTGEDEEGTHRALRAYLDVITTSIETQKGRVVHYAGDAVLADFATVTDALSCAVDIQRELKTRNQGLPDDRKVQFRIGVNLGEVIVDQDEIYGDGVNVAARLEGLAEPGGICISESVHTAIGNKLLLDYEFLGEQSVKNIEKPVRTYRVLLEEGAVPKAAFRGTQLKRPVVMASAALVVLVIGVITWWQPWVQRVEPASIERMAFPLPDKPSIAVLPFDNLSGDPKQEYLSDGISENIITELARFQELFVIARKSSFSYKGKPVRVRQVSEELGVRYVVEGSLQQAGERIRVAVQLIDATSGRHRWAERYDRKLEDVFAVQDEITRTIVSTLAAEVHWAEVERAERKRPSTLRAFELVTRGRELVREFTKEGTEQARQTYEEAIELDPNYGDAYEGLAWVYINGYRWGFIESISREESLKLGCEMAQKAVGMEPFWYRGHWALANCYMQRGELEQSLAEFQRALALNPNSSEVLADSAEPLVYLGRAQEAVEQYKFAIRLNPHHPDWFLWTMGWAQYFAGQYEDALATIKRMNKMPNGARRTLAPILVRLGRRDKARAVIEEFLENDPDNALENMNVYPFAHKEYLERWTEDLRTAGMPEKLPPTLPDKPSIAVLPFTNMSDDPKQEYFVDGMTEDLITDLSKLSGLFVIARNSVFTYKGKPVKVQQVAEELGVRYVLEGSVRRADSQVRINAQLIDATTGGHVWAERYDGSLANVFAMQDEVTQKIVTALAVNLTTEEKATQARIETDNPKAYDAFLQGWQHYRRGTAEDYATAASYLKQAIQLDPNYARAHSALAAVYWNSTWNGWWAQSLGLTYYKAFEQTRLYQEKAIEQPSALTHQVAAEIAAYYRRRPNKALTEAERAIALDANDPAGYLAMATALIKAGKPAEAVESVRTAMRLDPHYPASYLTRLGQAQFALGQYQDAAATLERATSRNPDDDWTVVYLAAAYGHLGREADAKAAVETANALRAKVGSGTLTLATVGHYLFRWAGDRKALREGLRKAGVEGGGNWFALITTTSSGFVIKGAATVDVETAKALHDRGVPFVDMYHHWLRGRIPGAHFLEWWTGEFNDVRLLRIVGKTQEVVIYSSDAEEEGRDNRLAAACANAVTWGFQKAYCFSDGFRKWKAAGYPVEVPSG